jgi:DNA (cytosine-5)-methyltransferase 1
MRHGSLFSGIGGFDLAAEWAGLENVWQVERDKFCQRVLRKNFPDAKIYDDITTLDLNALEHVDIVSGGFPCQPFSSAGKRRGQEDDRYLWPAMLAVIKAIRPTWVVGENVAGLISMGLDDVLASVEDAGYTVWPIVIPACALGAPHRRDRIWIVAYANGEQFRKINSQTSRLSDSDEIWTAAHANGGRRSRPEHDASVHKAASSEVATDNASKAFRFDSYAEGTRFCVGQPEASGRVYRPTAQLYSNVRTGWHEPWPEVATRICRVDDGLPRRVDRGKRLKALGNAIVPQVAYQIFDAINQAYDR